MQKHIHKIHKGIHKLREQPEETRRHLLHIITFTCAVILILLWIVGLGRTFKNKNTASSVKVDLQPFSVLKDNLTSGYKSVSTPIVNQ